MSQVDAAVGVVFGTVVVTVKSPAALVVLATVQVMSSPPEMVDGEQFSVGPEVMFALADFETS